MLYTKETLRIALAHILGEESFYAMETAGFALPRMCKEAAVEMFMCEYQKDGHSCIIRQALIDLEENGRFVFANEQIHG